MATVETSAVGSSQLQTLGQSAMNQSVMSLRETDVEGKIQTLQAVSLSLSVCMCVFTCNELNIHQVAALNVLIAMRVCH